MRSPLTIFVLSAALALPLGCNKPQPTPTETAEPEIEEGQDDGSDLSQFKKSKKKKRKKKRTKPSSPPTRQEGLEALEEGRMLIEEAEFVSAERELRVAAAAGVEGGDKMLLRVRAELAAEQSILAAQKKIAAKDYVGARGDLKRVPAGLILSDYARQALARIAEQEVEARKELIDKVSKRLEAPDSGEGEADPQPPPEP
ncbi:MAG TPA: hypothetical protein VGK67_18095 [Myxococcales bacterium]|jgi:hypothetical protein